MLKLPTKFNYFFLLVIKKSAKLRILITVVPCIKTCVKA